LERLYMEWERNDKLGDDDDDDDDDDEMAPHRRRSTPIDLREHQGKTAEDLLKITKKGETLLMFVSIRDPSSPAKKCRLFTEKYTDLWRSMLRNNHVTVLIDDDRAIFMFRDGSQAFEAKDFLLKQAQVTEILLEGQQYVGAGATTREEL
uniref:Thioredoxin-like_fold domain-containing protein n=1 Tax=Angiostrongylus cantonensis TaxID=6313 RepID=A0A158PBJ5_ANGCA